MNKQEQARTEAELSRQAAKVSVEELKNAATDQLAAGREAAKEAADRAADKAQALMDKAKDAAADLLRSGSEKLDNLAGRLDG